ncbi:UNVERIFIED_CONTAM: hypothetical protein PYX00_004054 [Menopon gallinae]|uniref:Transmembrane protein 183 n=1 Tax=Menopon gallinae TaxID=328185 RepID=A0AAW2I350_9NEOP
MQKQLQHKCKHIANVANYLTDVTLDDFANASLKGGSGRLTKNAINNVVTEVKHLSLAKDKNWDQKLDDLEFHATNKDAEFPIDTKKPNHKKKPELSEEINDDSGLIYPTEIWFLISDHIRPEDVGVFSLICRDSLSVVHTAKFWFNLYKRYYRKVPDLPERLRPECLVRRYRLRADVIRALHYMYPPFINKLKPQVILDSDPHALTKRVCLLCWYQEKKNQWVYYFKLEKSGIIRYGRSNGEIRKPTQLEILEDITANLDKNCKVLQVTCLNFIPLPMISGQILNGVSMTLSEGMRYHKLQLIFGCGPSPCMNTSSLIVLDPVLNVRILDWWHPLYPHSDGLNNTMYSNETISNCVFDPFDDLEF